MQFRNSADRYGLVTKALHWSIFALVAVQFVMGLSGNVDDDTHGSIGVVVLALVVLRIGWRVIGGLPDWAPTLRPAERHLAHWTERALYVGLLAKPLTGLAYIGADGDEVEFPGYGELPRLWPESRYWEDFFESAHAWSGYFLLSALALHVGLVLKHQLVDRDRLAHRMLPFTRQ